MRDFYSVILAGGRGERLWPLSRRKYPKQFLKILNKKSLFQLTLERVSKIDGKIIIVSPKEQIPILKNQIKSCKLPSKKTIKILEEPLSQNTSPAIILASSYIYNKAPDSIMAIFPSDHLIKDIGFFKKTIGIAVKFLQENGSLITFGIKPLYPSSEYGYIKKGGRIQNSIFKVKTFIEKPKQEKAISFFKRGNYYWNSGIFIWKTKRIVEEYRKILPKDYQIMMKIMKYFKSGIPVCRQAGSTIVHFSNGINSLYRKLTSISVDYAIMEKTKNIVIIEANFDWDDIGSLSSLANQFPKDRQGNVLVTMPTSKEDKKILKINLKNSIIFNSAKIPLVLQGLENLVIVVGKDVIFISKRSDIKNMKSIIKEVRKRKWRKIL
jgi:mannose-1-phosphate guanylyltransferase